MASSKLFITAAILVCIIVAAALLVRADVTGLTAAANFSFAPSTGYAPLTVNFTDESVNAISWNWTFGDGGTTTVESPNHTYSAAGNYTVTLTVWDNSGNPSTMSQTVTVLAKPPAPKANFTASPASGVAPLAVKFNDTSTGAPSSWQWNFGDESVNSTLQNPSHTYNKSGTYTVILTAGNVGGSNTIVKTNVINVIPVPIASFTANRTSGIAPMTAQFTDTSSGSPMNWSWSFGDGTANSTLKNPIHTYVNPGAYSVTLTVSNSNGSGTKQAGNYITVYTSTYPIVQFSASSYTYNETAGTATITVIKNGSATVPFSVKYVTSNGNAASGVNYGAVNGTLNFNASDASKSFTIPLLDDNVYSPALYFNISLSGPLNCTIGAPGNATVWEVNTDPLPTVIVNPGTYNVTGSAGIVNIAFTMSPASKLNTIINYSMVNGTAGYGSNYVDTTNMYLNDSPGAIANNPVEVETSRLVVDASSWTNISKPVPAAKTWLLKKDGKFNNGSYGANQWSGLESAFSGRLGMLNPGDRVAVSFWYNTMNTSSSGMPATFSLDLANSSYKAVSTVATTPIQYDGQWHQASMTVVVTQPYYGPIICDGPGWGYALNKTGSILLNGITWTKSSGQVVIPAGQTRVNKTIGIINNNTTATKTFYVNIVGVQNTTVGSPGNATVNIAYTPVIPSMPSVQFSASSYSYNETDGTISVTVVKSGTWPGSSRVNYTFVNDSALLGVDYAAANGESLAKLNLIPNSDLNGTTGSKPANWTEYYGYTDTYCGVNASYADGEMRAVTMTNTNLSHNVALLSSPIYVDNVSYTYSVYMQRLSSNYTSAYIGFMYYRANGSLIGYDYPVKSAGDVPTTLTRYSATVNPVLAHPGTAYVKAFIIGVSRVNASVIVTKPMLVPTSTNASWASDSMARPVGTLTFAPNDTSKTITVKLLNNNKTDPTLYFKIGLSAAVNASFGSNNYTTVSVKDVAALPSVQLSASSYTYNETNGIMTITVTKTGTTTAPFSVKYATSNGTALSGVNYNATSGTLSFNASDTSKTFTVGLRDDGKYDTQKFFNISISSPTNATLGSPNTAKVYINNKDAAPTVQFNASKYTFNETAGNVTITVTKAGYTNLNAVVNYSTSVGSATPGVNYNSTSGTLTFLPGDSSKTITVHLIDDGVYDAQKYFYLNLTGATNAAYGASRNVTVYVNNTESIINFTADKTSGYMPVAVQFNGTSAGSPISWLWNFGDGATSTEQNPQHMYSNIGAYTVTLTATFANGSYTVIKNNYICVASSQYWFSRSSYACDGNGTYYADNVPRIDDNGVMIEESTTNLLSNNQADVENNTSGFIAVDSIISNDSTHAWHGVQSLNITSANTSNNSFAAVGGDCGGIRSGMIAGNTYTMSAMEYVPASTGLTPDNGLGLRIVGFYRMNGAYYAAIGNAPTSTGVFQKVSCTMTIPGNATEAFFRLYNGFNNSSKSVWYDGIQLEQKPYATSWVPGGYTRNGDVITGPSYVLSPAQGTIEMRLYVDQNIHNANNPNWNIPFSVVHFANPYAECDQISLRRFPNTQTWAFVLGNSTGANQFLSTTITNTGWHDFALTWNNKSGAAFYLDGSLIQNSTDTVHLPSAFGYASDNANFSLVWPSLTLQQDSYVRDLRISNCARNASEIRTDSQSNRPLAIDANTTWYNDFGSMQPINIIENTETSQIVQTGNILITLNADAGHTYAVMQLKDLLTNETDYLNFNVTKINDPVNGTQYEVKIYHNGSLLSTSLVNYDPLEPGAALLKSQNTTVTSNSMAIVGQGAASTRDPSTLSTPFEWDGVQFISQGFVSPDPKDSGYIPYSHPIYDTSNPNHNPKTTYPFNGNNLYYVHYNKADASNMATLPGITAGAVAGGIAGGVAGAIVGLPGVAAGPFGAWAPIAGGAIGGGFGAGAGAAIGAYLSNENAAQLYDENDCAWEIYYHSYYPMETPAWQWYDGDRVAYNYDWMSGVVKEDDFGIGQPAPSSAQYVTDTIPTTMSAGQSYDVSVQMTNNGKSNWMENPLETQLGAMNDDAAKFWLLRQYISPAYGMQTNTPYLAKVVHPGETYNFQYTVRAPDTPGIYNVKYSMVWNSYNPTWFGDTVSKTITVDQPMTYWIDFDACGPEGPIPGYHVSVTVDGTNIFTATTGADGHAITQISPPTDGTTYVFTFYYTDQVFTENVTYPDPGFFHVNGNKCTLEYNVD